MHNSIREEMERQNLEVRQRTDVIFDKVSTMDHSQAIARIRTGMQHHAKAKEIDELIEGFANLENPDGKDPTYGNLTYAYRWFAKYLNRGCALYEDGVFEMYSHVDLPGEEHIPERREVPFKHHFDYYEAHLIAKDATLTKEVRVQKLRDMLEAFYPGLHED